MILTVAFTLVVISATPSIENSGLALVNSIEQELHIQHRASSGYMPFITGCDIGSIFMNLISLICSSIAFTEYSGNPDHDNYGLVLTISLILFGCLLLEVFSVAFETVNSKIFATPNGLCFGSTRIYFNVSVAVIVLKIFALILSISNFGALFLPLICMFLNSSSMVLILVAVFLGLLRT